MKMRKIIIFSVIMLFVTGLGAQNVLNNGIVIKNASPMHEGNNLKFNMSIDASKLDLSSREELILTPILKSVDGMKELPSVVITGNNKYKSNKRTEVLSKKTLAVDAYKTIRSKDAKSETINYDYAVPYEKWMEAARVEVKQQRVGCANCKNDEKLSVLSDSIIGKNATMTKPSDKLAISYLAPVAEAVKNRNRSGKAFLDFQVGKSAISADYRNNLHELTKIQEAITMAQNNKNAVLNSIELKGYASPEGSYKANEKLSESRSQSLKTYMQTKYKYPASLFKVSSVAEDWVDLRKLVDKSDLAQKQSVLDIIDNNKLAPDAKEAALKKLPANTYKTLLNDYFPQLRRVEYTVNYTIRAFSVDEGKQIINTHPGDLSLNEMFLVANTYPEGSKEFRDIFDVAVKMYPEDKTANLNAGANALKRGDLVSAHSYLDKLKDFPKAWNNLGTLYYMEGKYDQAKEYFTKAQKDGVTEAGKNLEIMKHKEEYDAMIQHAKEIAKKRDLLKQN